MLNLLRIGTCLALVLAIVSVNLWRDLRNERELTADLRAQVAASAGRDDATVFSPPRIDARGDAIDAGRDAAASGSGNGAVNPESPPPKIAPVTVANISIPNGFSPEGELMKDPDYRKARLTQAKMNLKRNYTGVAEEVGLSERETEQLFDILAEQQLGKLCAGSYAEAS